MGILRWSWSLSWNGIISQLHVCSVWTLNCYNDEKPMLGIETFTVRTYGARTYALTCQVRLTSYRCVEIRSSREYVNKKKRCTVLTWQLVKHRMNNISRNLICFGSRYFILTMGIQWSFLQKKFLFTYTQFVRIGWMFGN